MDHELLVEACASLTRNNPLLVEPTTVIRTLTWGGLGLIALITVLR